MKPITTTLAALALGAAAAGPAQAGSLTQAAEEAVLTALMDEYHAAAVYEALALAQAAAGNFAAAEKSLESAQSGYFFNGRFADVSRLDGQIAEVRQQRLPAEAWPAEDPLLRVPVISPLGPFKEYPAPRAY